jgi:DNA-binding GntR family transcriptional regulator
MLSRKQSHQSGEVRQTTRGVDIVGRLEEDILGGHFQPGDRLAEAALAERFGVSRTPIREALRQLGAAGLVEMRPRRGAVVRSLLVADIVHMLELMAEIEGFCARLAARRMTPAQRSALVALHKVYGALAQKGDQDGYFAASMRFHELIYAGTHNPFLEQTAIRIRHRISAFRRHQLRASGRLAQSLAEHEAVLKAILSGDAETADRLMHHHIDIVGDTFADLVSGLPVATAR